MLADGDIETIKQLTNNLHLPLGPAPPELSDHEFLKQYLQDVDHLPIHDLNALQHVIPRKMNPENVYDIVRKDLHLEFEFERDPRTGALLGFREIYKKEYGCTAQNSLSMRRRPGPQGENVKGNSSNIPFWPGGLDEPDLEVLENVEYQNDDFLDLTCNLKTVPPGFGEGIQFEQTSAAVEADSHSGHVISIADLIADDDFDLDHEDSPAATAAAENAADESIPEPESVETSLDISNFEELVPENDQKEVVKFQVPVEVEESWAVEIDISQPVKEFHQKIPDMARKWPFELDTFQKQAILHLERGECVFVAAHTSAGKTVVAEYAIALALKHKTKAVYTSPIKALSNQKFREFSVTFEEDVGLITGDVQLRQESSCLIMTTEILRSMLYNGSNVIRDLEWVIFDEVHYINDKERGVVWEEVLIMLPKDVNIILLSATVPNTIEFADWIGRTKKRKIYVIKTLKRPVPLEHFLYTGNSNKTSNELFQIVDSKKNFIRTGHQKAVDAKKERSNKSSQNFGPKGPRQGNPKQDKNTWLSLIHMLEKSERLPVIAFTFSKNRIEENIQHLQSLNLTTGAEKAKITNFCRKCVGRLKGTDARLPQVVAMQELLKQGIGKHHSGVLPILREMVEILFQQGLVKVLFATETFAMGVNMPAKTVVFDNIRKHDGTSFRNLQPGEYIQMAGRAGRRGLDSTGQVIILCKGDVPEVAELQIMMLGLPTKLESQFRLTYSMILNLLRVKQLRIEDMIKRSFAEITSQKDAKNKKEKMNELAERLKQLEPVECFLCREDIGQYYETLKDYRALDKELKRKKYGHPAAVKMIVAGRVVIVDYRGRQTLSVILKSVVPSSEKQKERVLTVLSLCEPDDHTKTTLKTSKIYQPMKLFLPEGECGHVVHEVTISEVLVITKQVLTLSADKIMENYNKRQIARFRHDPPGQSVVTCVQELLRLTEQNPNGFDDLDPFQDLRIRDFELVEKFKSLESMKSLFGSFQCEQCVRFDVHYEHHASNMLVEDEYRKIKFELSDESLKLLPEYEQRLNVLRSLRYISGADTIELKGRVATMISSHELLITELLTENVFTKLDPEEMAAILSCIVFEQKNCSEPELTERLKQGVEDVKEIAMNIGLTQRQHKMEQSAQDFVDSLHFGLVQVVYEWARGTPFHEITTLTDVQEGIIVRCIQRLNEILLDVRNAARCVGNPALAERLQIASMMIKRDIVFTASLYITQD